MVFSFFSFYKCIDVSHCLYFKFNMFSIICVVWCALRRCAMLDSYFNNDFFYATKTSCISTKKPQLLLVWFQLCELDLFFLQNFTHMMETIATLQLTNPPLWSCGCHCAGPGDQIQVFCQFFRIACPAFMFSAETHTDKAGICKHHTERP